MASSSSQSRRARMCSRSVYRIHVRRARRACGAGPANPFLGNAQAVSEGETLYNQKCTTCHGSSGGGGEIGPAIVSGDRADIGVSDAQTFNIIKNGVASTPMTPQRLPDTDIWKVVTYI